MSKGKRLNLRLSEEAYQNIKETAERRGVTVTRAITSAIALYGGACGIDREGGEILFVPRDGEPFRVLLIG